MAQKVLISLVLDVLIFNVFTKHSLKKYLEFFLGKSKKHFCQSLNYYVKSQGDQIWRNFSIWATF
jgi:hypothetical protein